MKLEGLREREEDDVSPSVLCRERLQSRTVIYGRQNFAATFPGRPGCSEGAVGWGGGRPAEEEVKGQEWSG